MKFYIIRHGKTARNGTDLITGQADIPITEEGQRQIEEAVKDYPKISSPYTPPISWERNRPLRY